MSRTRAQDYGQKKDSIRSESAKLFSEVGFHATSMTQVAKACGISKGLLYHYYKNKEALLFDILYVHLEDLLSAVRNCATKDAKPEEHLGLIIAALLDNYHNSDREHRIQLSELSSLPKEKQDILRELERQIVAPVNDVVSQLLPANCENALILKPTTMTLFGMVNWCFMWFKPTGNMGREEYAALVAKIFLKGITSL